ncbi:ComEC/Rec2 family competence protein [Patescibacteria group bacterium]|nr:ComEC/Rec2 family competence protein [Patescibacteria group bacterium]
MKAVWIVLIWLAVFSFRLSSSFQAEGNLREKSGNYVTVVGRVSSEPILQGGGQRFNLGNMTVYTKLYPQYEYGQEVQVSGTLQSKVVNKWYSRFSLMYPSIKPVKSDNLKIIGFNWKAKIMELRRKIESVYNQVLPEPEASLLAGVVLGSKRGLPRGFYEDLRTTGTLHIVVASGFNVMIVISFVVKALAGIFKRWQAVFMGILAVIGYTVMAGAEPAIVRAAIMGSLAFFGQIIGRKGDSMRLLLMAVMGMLLYKPILVWDVGFQLSVAATLGLMFISPLLKGVFDKIIFVGENMSETISAQIMVWPILMIYFNNLSLFSVVVNSLVLWLVPVLMTWGAILALVGLLFSGGWFSFLVKGVGWICYAGLTMMVRVIEWFGGQAWTSWPMKEGVVTSSEPWINWWWAVGYYVVLSIIIWRYMKVPSQRRAGATFMRKER